ncbi:MAG: hypothetical protein IPP07_04015 [Holophagales bacterium]|nr:hypothetical protein [Holophagales bacterium]MBK9964098.1 hypothetical protein [Holophagales bacterium]
MFDKVLVAGAVGALLLVTPQANAQGGNRNEISTFETTERVEVAGVILEPGTYVIRVIDQSSGETYNRNVIQITNEDKSKVFVTAAANPRLANTDPDSRIPLFEYYTAASGEPKALRTWFPAGTKTARDIVYPRKRALYLASITHETVPSVPDETKEAELKTVPLTPIVPERLAPPPAVETKPVAVVAQAVPAMPRTASHEPLFAALGLLSLAGALALRQLGSRVA